MDVKTDYTREELIAICEQAIVPEEKWRNRDSHHSQCKLGELWALLKAGCRFSVLTGSNGDPSSLDLSTDDRTIWVEVEAKGFDYFEQRILSDDAYYLPTPARLAECEGRDWY